MSTLHERLIQRTKKAEAAYEQEKQWVKDVGSAQIASRLDNPINSPSTMQRISDRQNAKLYADLTNTKWFEQYNNERGKALADNQQSALIASLLDGGSYAANAGTQAAIAQDNKNILSAQLAANLDNSLMGQATRDNAKASLERAMESLYNRMEVAKTAGQTDEYGEMQERYSYFANRLQEAENPESTAAYAYDWENKRRNEIMSTDDRYLMPKLERLVELSDARMSEASDRGDERRNGLTETEKEYNALYNSLKQQYGDKVDGWLDYTRREANKRNMAQREEDAKRRAEERKVGASLTTIPLNMFSGAGYLDVVAQKMQRGITGSAAPIDYNSAAQGASRTVNTIRSTVSEGMSGVGSFLYNAAMSMGDVVLAMPMGTFGMGLLGGAAATSAMQGAVARGASDGQALAVGLISGALEAVLEKASIDNLFKLKTPEAARDLVMNALKQAGAEGTEEGLTTIANTLADALIMGNRSELQTRVRELTADGASESEARKQALGEWGQTLLLDMAGGALSGGVFGGGKAAINTVMPKLRRNTQTSDTAVENITPTPEQRTQETAPVADITPQPAPAPTVENVMPQVTPVQSATDLEVPSTVGNGAVQDSQLNQTKAKSGNKRLYNKRDVRNGWGKAYDTAQFALNDAIKILDPALSEAFSDEIAQADGKMNYPTPIVDAVIAVQEDVRQDTLTPMQGAQLLSNAYSQSGIDGLKRLFNPRNGNLYENVLSLAKTLQVQPEQTPPVPELRTETVDITPEVRQSEQAQPEQTVPVNQSEPGNQPAMGAADLGFDPISHASIEYGTIPPGERASRIIDLPTSMDGKTKVSFFARTAAEAPVTSDEMAQRIMDIVEENKASHEVFSDDAALEAAGAELAAAYKSGDGYSIYTRFLQDVASGKAGKDIAATGSLLYADAVAAKDHESAAELFLALKELFERGGQTTQSARLLKKLTPEGRVFAVQKTADKINRDLIQEGRRGTELSNVPKQDIQNIVQAVEDAREAELQMLEGKETEPRRKKTVGGKLAETIDKNKNPPPKKPTPEETKVLNDLKEFAKTYMDKRKPQFRYSAAKALESFLLNREQYGAAWFEAQAILGEKYKGHQEMLDALDGFLQNDIGLEQIASGIDRDIKKALKVFGISPASLVKMTAGKRNETLTRVIRNLMMDNKLSDDDAAIMRQFITDRYEAVIAQEAEKAALRAENKKRNHGLAVEDWMAEIGKEVAKAVGAKPSAPGPKPISRTIKQDLLRFAKDYLPKKPQGQKRTAVDTLTDFFANRNQYIEAWNAAKREYVAKHGNDTDFAGATMTYNADGSDPVMVQAIIEEVVDSELKRRNVDIRTALGDQAALENQIADSLISDTRATGQDAAMIRDAVSRYFNEARLNADSEAIDRTIERDISKNLSGIGQKMSEIIRSTPGNKAAVAKQIAKMMTSQYGISPEAAQTAAENIVDRFNKMVSDRSRAAIENMLKDRGKNAQKTLDQRFRELVNMGAFAGSDYATQITQKLFGAPVQIDPDLIDQYAAATTDDEIREAAKAIYRDIGQKIPSNFRDKWNAWRHTAMLGTFKSPERNFIGNTAGQAMRIAKNVPASIAEAMFVDQSERTKSVLPAGKDLKAVAKNDLKNVKNELEGIGKHHIVNNEIQNARQIFTPRVAQAVRTIFPDLPQGADNISMEGVRKLVRTAMSDRMFSEPTYVSSLAGFLKARGYTAEDFTGTGMTEAQKAEARDYAISEALKATYRDLNVASELITATRFKPQTAKSDASKKAMEIANIGLEGIMPYLKTPANILMRGIEYDPVLGTVTSIFKAAHARQNGDFKATQLIDDLSKAFTGGAIATIGYFMRANNLIMGASDDEQDDLEGKQEYSLMIGGKAIPIDWMAPFCMPLFVGVEFYNLLDKTEEEAAPLTSKVASSLTSITSALFNTSMLDGLQDAIDNVKYAENAMIALVANATIGYLGQAVPTLFGQLERAVSSPYSEMTFVDDANKWLDEDWQRALGTLSRKIPGWDYNQIPYIDAWGRKTETGNFGKRLVNNLFNPANVSEIKVTDVDLEIRRLEDSLGIELTPSRAKSDITVNGTKIFLTADEYLTYAQAKGQNDLTFRQNLIDDSSYSGLDDSIKAEAMKKASDFADVLAKREAGFDPELPGWQEELIGADAQTITDAFVAKAIETDLGTGAKWYEDMAEYASNPQLEEAISMLFADSVKVAYDTHISESGVSLEQFLDALAFEANAKSEKKDGKTVSGSKKAKVEDFINSLPLEKDQKAALYLSMPDGYSKDTMPRWD